MLHLLIVGIGYGLSGCLGVYAYKQLVKGLSCSCLASGSNAEVSDLDSTCAISHQ